MEILEHVAGGIVGDENYDALETVDCWIVPGLCRTDPCGALRPDLVGDGWKSGDLTDDLTSGLTDDLTSGRNPCLGCVIWPCPRTAWAMIHNHTGMKNL